MPIRKEDYPPDWKEISLAARARAGQQCEWCAAPNGEWIKRDENAGARILRSVNNIIRWYPRFDFSVLEDETLTPRERRAAGYTKIILTVAHLDRNRRNNDPSNLAALCQRCHLNHDRHAQHIPHRKFGRYHDREEQGKLEL